MIERKYLTITLLLFTIFSLITIQAQQTHQGQGSGQKGRVMIAIVDENSTPIEYATVYLQRASDSTTVQYTITDRDGKAVLPVSDYGTYYIKVQYMSYSTHISSDFEITAANPTHRINKFKMVNKANELSGVEVVAQREMLQNNLDKKVFNVESSVVADGATAIEVLEDVPAVDVDIEGNVTLRGSENVTILVDGRPTNLTLDQIPASMIESIEVVTNPSARMDPDGMSGIINVVLKKKKEGGFNGMVTAGVAPSFFQKQLHLDRYNASISLNYTYSKINVFLNYDFRRMGRRSAGTMDRFSWFKNTVRHAQDSTHLTQENNSISKGMSHNVTTGLDWFINKQNTLSFTFGYNYWGNSDTNDLLSNNYNYLNSEDIPLLQYNQLGGSNRSSHNFNAGINYKKLFNQKGMELTADLFFTQRINNSESRFVQDFSYPDATPNYYQRTNTLGNNRTATAQVDFVTPIGNGGRIEAGYKFSYRSIGQDYALFNGYNPANLTEDVSQSNDFIFNEFINAAYLIYSNTFWKKLKAQFGLRGEWANTVSKLMVDNSTKPFKGNYPGLFPTVHIQYEFNPQHALQVSYSRRVTRPSIWQLNPFLDYSDKQNLRQGNPNLRPEYVNSVELGYLMNINNSSLSATAFYRYRSNIISRYTESLRDTTDLEYTLTSYQNLNKSQNFGFELIYGQRLWKFWKITFTGTFYRMLIDSKNLIDENLSQDWAWNLGLNQSFSLPKDWDLQLNFRFRSRSITTGSMGWGTGGVGQGRRSANYSLNFGVKKSFLNKNLIISLNIRDLIYIPTKINTYSHENPERGYDAVSIRERNAYQTTLTISYKINNYKRRSPDRNQEAGTEGEGIDE
ncbi:MAG: TonB-dependent receptor [Bacteroidales bacterium]|jgi:outer membrane receptor protein involved in Fe transport|nr:TonB-dependent receptor [Bacteroidales bacterium]